MNCKRFYGDSGTTSSRSSSTVDKHSNRDGEKVRNDMWSDYKKRNSEAVGEQVKIELEKYLAEEAEDVRGTEPRTGPTRSPHRRHHPPHHTTPPPHRRCLQHRTPPPALT